MSGERVEAGEKARASMTNLRCVVEQAEEHGDERVTVSVAALRELHDRIRDRLQAAEERVRELECSSVPVAQVHGFYDDGTPCLEWTGLVAHGDVLYRQYDPNTDAAREAQREEVVDEDVVDDLCIALVRCGAVTKADADRRGRAPEEMGEALLRELRRAGYIDNPAEFIKGPDAAREALREGEV